MIQDTIAAISTALGEAAISVLRLSGPQALKVAGQVFRAPKSMDALIPRHAYLTHACDRDGQILDQGLLQPLLL